MDNKAPVIADDINASIKISADKDATPAAKQPAPEQPAPKEEKKDSSKKKTCLQRVAPFVAVKYVSH
jgi:hypothetical protein